MKLFQLLDSDGENLGLYSTPREMSSGLAEDLIKKYWENEEKLASDFGIERVFVTEINL